MREETPLSIDAVERVSGSWWLGEGRKPIERHPCHEQKHAIIHLHLPKLGVFTPVAEVVAFIAYGSLERVELAADTRFATHTGETLIDLSAGVSVMEMMSLDGQLALRKEIGL